LKIDKEQNRFQLFLNGYPMDRLKMKSRCKSQTKAGEPCGGAPTPCGLCFFHANPEKAVELGRIGGRSKRHSVVADGGDPLPPLDTTIAVRDRGNRLFDDVIAGKVPPRVAAVLVSLLNLQMRAIYIADLEPRLARLEQQPNLTDSTANEPTTVDDQERESKAASGEFGETGD
jgi:hypothetical protein